jgi:hypothetical protein
VFPSDKPELVWLNRNAIAALSTFGGGFVGDIVFVGRSPVWNLGLNTGTTLLSTALPEDISLHPRSPVREASSANPRGGNRRPA